MEKIFLFSFTVHVLLFTIVIVNGATLSEESETHLNEPKQSWDYVTVRPKAHMFYWLYETTHSKGAKDRPLILWLQGGPGGSSTGYGNFMELGPLDVNLNPRKTNWVQTASVLFIDNPVGTGYSYVEVGGKFTTDVAEISADLLTCMQAFIKKHPDFEKNPFYIFSESYGGKMTAAFSAVLYKAVKQGKINLNFQGLAMGDSWISPADSVNGWAPFLYGASLVDLTGYNKIMAEANKVQKLVDQGQWGQATEEWGNTEGVVETETGGVSFYNIMDWGGDKVLSSHLSATENLYQRHVAVYADQSLEALMNGPIKKKLKIIPDDVTWGGQSQIVFAVQARDFMKNVSATVNYLINETKLTVVVYEGQLDLICGITGAVEWFYRLDVAKQFMQAPRKQYSCQGKSVCYYAQKYKNVQFYWILDAGHMVPSDNGYGALDMVNKVIED